MIKKVVKTILSFATICGGLGTMIGFTIAGNPLAGATSVFAAAFLTAYIATR